MQEIHGIDLLQTLPVALDEEEIHHQCRNKVTGRKNVTVREADFVSDERREEREVEIPELFPKTSIFNP